MLTLVHYSNIHYVTDSIGTVQLVLHAAQSMLHLLRVQQLLVLCRSARIAGKHSI
jgi:hypothetical protein